MEVATSKTGSSQYPSLESGTRASASHLRRAAARPVRVLEDWYCKKAEHQ